MNLWNLLQFWRKSLNFDFNLKILTLISEFDFGDSDLTPGAELPGGAGAQVTPLGWCRSLGWIDHSPSQSQCCRTASSRRPPDHSWLNTSHRRNKTCEHGSSQLWAVGLHNIYSVSQYCNIDKHKISITIIHGLVSDRDSQCAQSENNCPIRIKTLLWPNDKSAGLVWSLSRAVYYFKSWNWNCQYVKWFIWILQVI